MAVKPDPISEDKIAGVYFIRTNYSDPDEGRLWDIYNTICEVESTIYGKLFISCYDA